MNIMKPVIPPVEKHLLEKELTKDRFFRHTNYGSNELYVFDGNNSPNLMREVGRLRELAFRDAGGGTGQELDIDHYDGGKYPYQQLIVWDPRLKEIMGGYRFFDCGLVTNENSTEVDLATSHLFKFSEKFIKEYLPYTIELGRSFVQPEFQSSKSSRKAIFTLDNLWDGMGLLSIKNKHAKYFFGKVTMYTHYDAYSRDILLYFLKTFFPDRENLLTPIDPLPIITPEEELAKIFTGSNYAENYKILSLKIREQNETIPPLINSYMSLTPTLKTFGTAVNHEFGNVEETGILITINDIYASKKERHISGVNTEK